MALTNLSLAISQSLRNITGRFLTNNTVQGQFTESFPFTQNITLAGQTPNADQCFISEEVSSNAYSLPIDGAGLTSPANTSISAAPFQTMYVIYIAIPSTYTQDTLTITNDLVDGWDTGPLGPDSTITLQKGGAPFLHYAPDGWAVAADAKLQLGGNGGPVTVVMIGSVNT